MQARFEQFREEVRAFCRQALPADIRRKVAFNLTLERSDHARWQKILHGRGWMGGHWPREWGGQGWKPLQRWLFEQTLAEEGAPWLIPMGVAYVGPVIYTFGSEDQKCRFLPSILSADHFWAQGYSEPNAGSDLAGLKTRAERRGDHFVVNGQKTWTTYAHWADWMFCLTRTESGARPQDGVSFLLIDMKTPGITVRPIATMDGKHHVNEVFFDNVRVPVENLVGEEGKAWRYAKFLLVQERLIAAETGRIRHLLEGLRAAAEAVQEAGVPLTKSPAFAARIADLEIELAALEAVCARLLAKADGDAPGGVEVNLLKIRSSELQQRVTEEMIRALGRLGIPFDPANLDAGANLQPLLPEGAAGMASEFMHLRAATIYGGSNEIQRGIIAKQGLGL
ncbi:acyl-CoA dehydrogenase family protein [Bradyrhizobium sp. AS23.2]|uniref:acyl-CoA dehydrogenase family protein n=1 Tax=Bradyrhizobium sp. AS23.2 TaxID=1680155 RepID=UPI000940184C|nr:acyl-CoA dehydrogenase family protein [Bradyrhizobium sp. AS23.2]OKO78291.1 acyl-CoA dehydrogenase [Bradyrhizobium sp. AS23.2]